MMAADIVATPVFKKPGHHSPLTALGYGSPLENAALRPGAERSSVVRFLMKRLVQPASLDQVLGRLEELDPQPQQLPEEERHAHQLVMLLRQIGVETTSDVVRGSITSTESLKFLQDLTSLVHLKESAEGRDGAAAADMVATCAPLLEFACSNFPKLTSESRQLFPSDVTRAISHNFVHADAVLASCSECCIALVSDAERMHAAVSALSPDGASLPDRAEWAGTVASLQHALHAYLASVTRFSEVYASELGVWCEAAPPARTHGVGAATAPLLAAYARLLDVSDGIHTIRQAHNAVSCSAPPLVAFQPDALRVLAERAAIEARAMASQAAVLQKALAQERQLQAAAAAALQQDDSADAHGKGVQEDELVTAADDMDTGMD